MRAGWAATFLTLILASCGGGELEVETGGPVSGWPEWGGDPGGSKFSPLTQIDRQNVQHLEVAWTFHTGDPPAKLHSVDGRKVKTAFQATPVLDGDTLYFCSPYNRVFAVDAESGAQRWVYDPGVADADYWSRTCRGVSFWRDPLAEKGKRCSRRIFTNTLDARLIALDADSGRPCSGFGRDGQVDLRRGLSPHTAREYRVTSLPTVLGDVVAVGSNVADAKRVDVPSGVVRGFDARTGELRWAFDPAPPGTAPLPPLADGTPQYHPGTPNVWGIMSADPERELLFLPTGNPSPDFYRGEGTLPELDHYGSSVVALRGSTGQVVWHFQTVHHDLWDYDVSAQPALIEVVKDGRTVPAVAQATKMGFLFLLHRETGEPIYPVEERPVPQGGAPEERLSPTQPFPTHPPPLHPVTFTADDAWGLTPIDRALCRGIIEELRSEGIYTPPSLQGSVVYPGVAGGTNWGGLAFDPGRRIVVMNQSRMANISRLVPRAKVERAKHDPPFEILFRQEGVPYALHQGVLVSPLGVPCVPTPWGTLLAVDLDSGEKLWEIPFGSTRGNAPFPFWFNFGMPSMGGPIVTASGLLFIGAAMDGYLRALDVETGRVIWKQHLPGGGQATPLTYRLRPDGRQFVVIAAGGHGTLGTEISDSLVAFALPIEDTPKN